MELSLIRALAAVLLGRKCVHLKEWFEHHGHVCLVFELLDKSLYDFLEENEFEPFPMAHIQSFGRQMITAVACKPSSRSSSAPDLCRLGQQLTQLSLCADLHRLGLVHTDLKPEKTFFASSAHRAVRDKVSGSGLISVAESASLTRSLCLH